MATEVVTASYVNKWAASTAPRRRADPKFLVDLPELPEQVRLPADLLLLDDYYLQLARSNTMNFLKRHSNHQSRREYLAAIESPESLLAMMDNPQAGFWAEAVASYEVSSWLALRHYAMANSVTLPQLVEPEALSASIRLLAQADSLPVGSAIQVKQDGDMTIYHVSVPGHEQLTFSTNYSGIHCGAVRLGFQRITNPGLRHYIQTLLLARRIDNASNIPGHPCSDYQHPMDLKLPRHKEDTLEFHGHITLVQGPAGGGLGQNIRELPVPVQDGWAQHMFSDSTMTGAKAYRIFKDHLEATRLGPPASSA